MPATMNRLAKGGTREVIWRLLMEPPIESYVNRRVNAYRTHEAAVTEARPAALAKAWTHAFVDECQDFTRSDIRLLARVPLDPRNLCMACDASQAIHLGRSYDRPGIPGAQWKTHLHAGWYRLALRVCEALQPLARDIRSSHLASRLQDDLDSVARSEQPADPPSGDGQLNRSPRLQARERFGAPVQAEASSRA